MIKPQKNGAGLPTHELVYRQLRDMVLFGELLPGQAVTIQGLIQHLSAGMTPVREALRRLIAEVRLNFKNKSGQFFFIGINFNKRWVYIHPFCT